MWRPFGFAWNGIIPPRKDRALDLPLPAIDGADAVPKAMAAIVDAMAEGRITPSEAAAVAGLVEAQRRTIAPEPPPQIVPVINIKFTGSERREA